MKRLLLAAAAFTLLGCESENNITGTLQVKSALTVLSPGGTRSPVAPGSYRTTIRSEAANTHVFIRTKQGEVQFRLATSLLKDYGKISIPASRIGQEFGLQGAITRSTHEIDRHASEQCLYGHEMDHVCERNSSGQVVCEWKEIPVYGSQTIRETGFGEQKDVKIQMVRSGKSLATYSGRYNLGETIERRELIGYCERSRW